MDEKKIFVWSKYLHYQNECPIKWTKSRKNVFSIVVSSIQVLSYVTLLHVCKKVAWIDDTTTQNIRAQNSDRCFFLISANFAFIFVRSSKIESTMKFLFLITFLSKTFSFSNTFLQKKKSNKICFSQKFSLLFVFVISLSGKAVFA